MSFKNIIVKKGRNSDFLIICDHASNNIDEKYGNLGLEKKYINSHRAFDIGAKNVAYQQEAIELKGLRFLRQKHGL